MTDYPADTMSALLARGAAPAPAIGAPGRPWLTYAALRAQAADTVATLNAAGIGRGDRIAIVLPNGPEMAAFFLCAACACTTAPLNPAYKPDEFTFYLDDLNAAALIVQSGADTPARAVAAARNIPIIELSPGEAAGSFSLSTTITGAAKQPGPAIADDTALVLHTSGTTSRPKIVPLSHRNVTASAYHIGETLALTTEDVCLNIMPLFHIHGLIAAVLASLAAGGAVSCTPGFNAFAFFAQFEEVRPTWLTAVPTMHQTLLTRAARHAESIKAGRLRLLRTSSASLPPAVMAALEATFHVPVIESYGMTEAAHQMASNPLPPRARYPGSVGLAAGPEIAIMGLAGELLPANEPGEIVIRGRNVTTAYENNPDANAKAFHDGWFRTGDEGVLDEEGYLRLTGRLKEIIIRGGEKISPLEVDNALMDHPDVAQALTFAIPHDKLGEEVGACIVLRDGAPEDEHAIRDFVGEHLAPFKVPRRIVFLAEIPKGPTGKLMRIGLAQKLGLAS
jgi:acyl-CoA synthetase (AMP-forming)/AMP-acid ligase II